jgi:ribosomal protein S18 acetylase RimI-like enzyme
MSLYLRPALPTDEVFLEQLVYENLYEQLYAWAWDPAIREPLLKIQIDGQRASYAASFPRADHGIIMLDGRAIGRLIVNRAEQEHYLVDIVLKKESRGKGVGTWLLRALCMEAELARKPLRLQVQPTNRAKDLYLRLGFRMIEDRQITWLMERAVGAAALVSL